MTHLDEMWDNFNAATAAVKAAWRDLSVAIVEAAPVHVGDIIQLTEDGVVEPQVYQIAIVKAVDWGTKGEPAARYEVRKRTKDGWHKTIMAIGGLSGQVNRGRYIQLTMDELLMQEQASVELGSR